MTTSSDPRPKLVIYPSAVLAFIWGLTMLTLMLSTPTAQDALRVTWDAVAAMAGSFLP
jgi:hypothetical protein